jgi:hypothetical protein
MKKYLINTAVSVLGTVILVTVGWYLLHGVPLTGVPDVEDISSITVADENREVTVDREDFELMVNENPNPPAMLGRIV